MRVTYKLQFSSVRCAKRAYHALSMQVPAIRLGSSVMLAKTHLSVSNYVSNMVMLFGGFNENDKYITDYDMHVIQKVCNIFDNK